MSHLEKLVIPNLLPRLPLKYDSLALGLIGAGAAVFYSFPIASYLGLSDLSNQLIKDGFLLCGAGIGAYSLGILSLIDKYPISRTKKVNFLENISADVNDFSEDLVPSEAREKDIIDLVESLNTNYMQNNLSTKDISKKTANAIQEYIKKITNQDIRFYHGVRNGFNLAGIAFASLGIKWDDGEITVYPFGGNLLLPQTIAHEQAHRIGYNQELDAQLLSYYALAESQDPLLMQSAKLARLLSHFVVLSEKEQVNIIDVANKYNLRPEFIDDLFQHFPKKSNFLYTIAFKLGEFSRKAMDKKLSEEGQNGISIYDLGFTNALYLRENNIGKSF